MEERKAFSFYRSYYEASKDLPTKEDRADFLMAICSYIFDGVEPEITGVASAMFKLAKPNLETSIKRANAGQIGGSSNKKENKAKANDKQNESKTEANDKQSESQVEAINDYMINDYMINEKEKINKKEKPQKHQYGEYKNVLLSDDELQKLQTEFPSDWKERIENVSEYCQSHGKTYKDYLATMRNWAKREKRNATRPTPIRKNDVAGGYQRLMEILGGNDDE